MVRVPAAVAAVSIAALSIGAQALATPAPDAYSIYDRARHVWAEQRYPSFLSYTIAVRVSERGVEKSRHYHLTFDAQNDAIEVNPVSDEEQSVPPTPTGFVLHLQPRRQGRVLVDRKVGNPGEAVDYLGVPKLSPTYAFGMTATDEAPPDTAVDSAALVDEIRKEFNDPRPPVQQASAGPLKTIAVISSRTHAYTITLSGMDDVDGRQCWHLLLSPNRDPQKLRLRELWIDAATYQTRRLLSAGNFTGSDAPWLVTFEEIGGAMYIASETALAPIGVGDHRYEKATIAFETIAPAQRPLHANSFFATKENIMAEPEDGGNRP